MPLDPLPTPDAPQLERHEAEAMVEGLADMAAGRIRSLAEIDAPPVTFPDGCAADPIKTFEGYPGIQVNAPQVELGPCALHDHFGEGECPDCAMWSKAAEADAQIASLLAERDRARSAYRDQHAKTLFEHERAERAEAEKARLEGENRELRKHDIEKGCGACGDSGCCSEVECGFNVVYWRSKAEAAEASLAALRDAVREWKEAKDGLADGGNTTYRSLFAAEAKLRALVDPQGANE